ncbi:EAL domain-containing protein [Massilia sp. erpn]|uniref:EAL domain-containing protein n=1 Tax=Massilia sp. erpn TaxID=2738142 RepID=UPI00210334E3|nr:EAL domain-containing protein [Massilia sp. erpn]UTY55853.1 EAL domain-containing protein [Massilia sp. erpn]
MTRTLSGNPHFFVSSMPEVRQVQRFERQPIMSLRGGEVVGHELLYRGKFPGTWAQIDASLLRHLQVARSHPLLFINLSNQGLLDAAVDDLVRASERNAVIFELSESVAEYALRERIAEKVNTLMERGVRVAIDDFGAGRDSLERLYELGPTTAVKIDGVFLQTCARRADAAKTLQYLIGQWREAGVLSIAEGVENAALYEFAQLLGCDMVQGWYVDALVNQAGLKTGVFSRA